MSRPNTYAKHSGRTVSAEQQLDIFAAADPVPLRRRRQHAKPRRRVEPPPTPEEVRVTWIELAVDAVRRIVVTLPEKGKAGQFTMEQMRAKLDGLLWAPPDLRAWGKVTVMLLRRKIIQPTGRYAPTAAINGSAMAVYRRGPEA